jgi:hypothetical protein
MARFPPLLSPGPQWRHLLVLSAWRRWLFPLCCAVPYLLCVVWMLEKGLVWVAQVMVAPLFMGAVLALLTWWLARAELRGRPSR